MEKPTVQLIKVTKKIGKKTIIHDLSFEVPKGEVFGFLGPNGAGKTTTIRMMVGLMRITSGDVLIEGHSITKDFEKAIKHVGAIVENPEMYKYLTGYQNLIHFARMSKGVTPERIQEVIHLVGLENRIHEKVKKYSLGMRQRLGVAQALLHRPSLLILDEPTNGLDPAGIRELRDYLRELAQKENISVVVSSHLLSEMELMCDRIGIIQNGKLVDVRLIKDFVSTGEGEAGRVSFEVDSVERALAALSGSDLQAAAVNGGIELVAVREQIAEANVLLVQAGVKIYGIRPLTKTLEDKFLEMTGSDQIA
ncbi:ABC transporter ATP-binding protein [Gorillibacterium massiliense]|uniref:ABC transporter ATP-binding protein n=1 Tax=Gorillibacterium massiliense TaxID=1280390 RepID=UPI0004AFD75A|nr:ABC transporter ATP-binding protein [Gorillibacterium massiliense]